MDIVFSNELILGLPELNFLKDLSYQSLKKLISTSKSFGLVKLNSDVNFDNGKVFEDTNTVSVGYKYISLNSLFAINNKSQYLQLPSNFQSIPVSTSSNKWYWVKAKYSSTSEEPGLFTLSASGILTGNLKADLFKVLRISNNDGVLSSRIKFLNSKYNLLEYEIEEFYDTQTIKLKLPDVKRFSGEVFVEESDLKLAVVGTFTPGAYVEDHNKNIFRYDSSEITLVEELIYNTKPNYVLGEEFYLARVRVNNNQLSIQDKRSEFYSISDLVTQQKITYYNTVLGLDYIQKDERDVLNTKFQLKINWGISGSVWTVESNTNKIVIEANSFSGGKIKSLGSINDIGFLVGCKILLKNNSVSRQILKPTILQATKKFNNIELTVDVIDINQFSNDGGVNFYQDDLLIIPEIERYIDFEYTLDSTRNKVSSHSLSLGSCILEVSSSQLIQSNSNIHIKYRVQDIYTHFLELPSGSYYDSNQYNNGVLINNPVLTNYSSGVFNLTRDITTSIIIPITCTNTSLYFDNTGLGLSGRFSNYAICNGNNNTPDLTSSFIGSNSSYSLIYIKPLS